MNRIKLRKDEALGFKQKIKIEQGIRELCR